jgi:hypothetical protein
MPHFMCSTYWSLSDALRSKVRKRRLRSSRGRPPVKHQQVEGTVGEGRGLLPKTPAQLLKVRPAPLADGHDLPVHHGDLQRKRGYGVANEHGTRLSSRTPCAKR